MMKRASDPSGARNASYRCRKVTTEGGEFLEGSKALGESLSMSSYVTNTSNSPFLPALEKTEGKRPVN